MDHPFRLRRRSMPRKLDGSGQVYIQACERAFEVLRLDELPWGNNRSLEQGRLPQNMTARRRSMSGRNGAYRVLMERPDGWPHKRDPTLSFQLSSGHINETLYFLAEFWRVKEVPFQRITNQNGNGFNSAGLSGYHLGHLSNS